MNTPSPFALASMVLSAPGWVRVGIAAPSGRTREAAALELGALIYERLDQDDAPVSRDQLALPL